MSNHQTLQDRYRQARETLSQYDQEHLLAFYDQIDDIARARLLTQIETQNWPRIHRLIQTHVLTTPEATLPADIQPAPYYPHQPADDLADKYRQARQRGEQLLRDSKVAAFTVAGGQGTRLGWKGPKGTFPATPVLGKTLFQVFAEYLVKAQRKYQATIPWYIMTSPINDQPTRNFFEENHYFGLEPANVTFFPQGTLPSISTEGKVLLQAPDELALNPDGHGGSLLALYTSGALADMQRRGVEQISYFQVDNPLVKCVDPLFLGLHNLDQAQMSSKMLTKTGPKEKVGNFALIQGRVSVIEYSDLPEEIAEQHDENGELRFRAGSIAIHVISTDFVQQINEGEGGFQLPFHRAQKKVPFIDLNSGKRVDPEQPNAIKLEAFVFDALPLCEKSIILETLREEEFAPIKNAEGVDSAATSRQLQSDRAARWLETVNVQVPWKGDRQVDAVVELSHLTAIEPEDLKKADHLPERIQPGQEIAL